MFFEQQSLDPKPIRLQKLNIHRQALSRPAGVTSTPTRSPPQGRLSRAAGACLMWHMEFRTLLGDLWPQVNSHKTRDRAV